MGVVHGDHDGAVGEAGHLPGLEGDDAPTDLELLAEALQHLPSRRRRRRRRVRLRDLLGRAGEERRAASRDGERRGEAGAAAAAAREEAEGGHRHRHGGRATVEGEEEERGFGLGFKRGEGETAGPWFFTPYLWAHVSAGESAASSPARHLPAIWTVHGMIDGWEWSWRVKTQNPPPLRRRRGRGDASRAPAAVSSFSWPRRSPWAVAQGW